MKGVLRQLLENLPVSENKYKLMIEVVEVQGQCPIYQAGDHFHIQNGYQLITNRPVCMHALGSICPYYASLSRGITPADLGLAGPDGAAYVQCLDPHRYTGGGSVTFRISQV